MRHIFPVQQVRVHPDVVARRLGDRAVLVHLGTNHIFELNETGTRIWELIAEHGDLDAVSDRIVAEFQVDRREAGREIDALVDRLARAGLLQS